MKEEEEKHKKEDDISVTLSVDASSEAIDRLQHKLTDDPEIEKVDLQEALGIGEAILISVIAGLLLDAIRKVPAAIKRLEELIQRILLRAEKVSKGKTQPKLVIQVKFTVFEFRSSSINEIKKIMHQIVNSQ